MKVQNIFKNAKFGDVYTTNAKYSDIPWSHYQLNNIDEDVLMIYQGIEKGPTYKPIHNLVMADGIVGCTQDGIFYFNEHWFPRYNVLNKIKNFDINDISNQIYDIGRQYDSNIFHNAKFGDIYRIDYENEGGIAIYYSSKTYKYSDIYHYLITPTQVISCNSNGEFTLVGKRDIHYALENIGSVFD